MPEFSRSRSLWCRATVVLACKPLCSKTKSLLNATSPDWKGIIASQASNSFPQTTGCNRKTYYYSQEQSLLPPVRCNAPNQPRTQTAKNGRNRVRRTAMTLDHKFFIRHVGCINKSPFQGWLIDDITSSIMTMTSRSSSVSRVLIP